MRRASFFASTGAFLLLLGCGGRSVTHGNSRANGEDAGSGGSASGGSKETGGSGGSGGTDVSPPTGCDCSDLACTAALENFCNIVLCPVLKDGAWYDPGLCANHAERTTYSVCSDGTSRFRWNWGFDTDYEVVFTADGELVYGTAPRVTGGTCRAGLEPPDVDCRTCDYCPSDAGQSPGEPPPCSVDENGRISPP